MSDRWYYARQGQSYGPLDFAQVQQLVASGSLVPSDLVLVGGAQAWVLAQDVPGLFFDSSVSPTQPATPEDARVIAWGRLREIARCQQQLLQGILFAVGVNTAVLHFVPEGKLFGLSETTTQIVSCVLLSVLIACFLTPLGRVLGYYGPLVPILGLVPGINILALLYLNYRASRALRSAKVKVGFLGTSLPEEPPASFVPKPLPR